LRRLACGVVWEQDEDAQKPVAGYSLDFARATRQYTILVALACDLPGIHDKCFQGRIKAPGLTEPIHCLGLFTTQSAFKGIQEVAEIVRHLEEEIVRPDNSTLLD
jgi:hypothetical protein